MERWPRRSQDSDYLNAQPPALDGFGISPRIAANGPAASPGVGGCPHVTRVTRLTYLWKVTYETQNRAERDKTANRNGLFGRISHHVYAVPATKQ